MSCRGATSGRVNTCRVLDRSARFGEVCHGELVSHIPPLYGGGTVQSAAALVTQLFKAMPGKHAMLHGEAVLASGR